MTELASLSMAACHALAILRSSPLPFCSFHITFMPVSTLDLVTMWFSHRPVASIKCRAMATPSSFSCCFSIFLVDFYPVHSLHWQSAGQLFATFCLSCCPFQAKSMHCQSLGYQFGFVPIIGWLHVSWILQQNTAVFKQPLGVDRLHCTCRN